MKFKWKNLFKKEVAPQDTTSKELELYYDRTAIDETNASYRLIIGQRSNRQDIQCIENNFGELFKRGKESSLYQTLSRGNSAKEHSAAL